MKWFKFYGQDWMTDPKIAGMLMEDKLCLITLLCMASSENKNGVISYLEEHALINLAQIPDLPTFDVNPAENARGILERLQALRIVTLDGNGQVTLCNFGSRQQQSSSNAEKQKRYRDSKKTKQTNTKVNSNATVTIGNARGNALHRIEENRIDKNISSASAKKTPQFTPQGAEILKSFETVDPKNKTYYANKTQRAACEFLLSEYGMEKVLDAIKILPQVNLKKLYIRQITTPYDLKENWVKIGNALKLDGETKKVKII